MKLSKGEQQIAEYLKTNGISYMKQFTISLNNTTKVVDFYIPYYRTAIQYDRRPLSEEYKEYCKKHKIHLIEIPYNTSNIIWDLREKLLSLGIYTEEPSGKKSLIKRIRTKLFSWVTMLALIASLLRKNKSKTSKKS